MLGLALESMTDYDGTNLVALAKPLFTPGLDTWSVKLATGLHDQAVIRHSKLNHRETFKNFSVMRVIIMCT